MAKISYEEFAEAVKAQNYEFDLTEEEFDNLDENEINEISKQLAGKAIIARSARSLDSPRDSDEGKKDRAKLAKSQERYGKKHGTKTLKKISDLVAIGDRYEEFEIEEETMEEAMKGEDEYNARYGPGGKKKPNPETSKPKPKKMEEETAAAATLHPKGAPGEPMSKVEAMASAMTAISGMSKGDLNKFAETMSQFGPGKTYGVGDNSAKNSSTIDTTLGKGPKTKDGMPKLNVKEDIDDMFAGQDLSEEFKDNVATLFEAAVGVRINMETARLEEEYENALNEEIAAFSSELNQKIDTYLEYVVENWMTDNEVAIESTLRNELMEEFMEGLKNLFSEHYISVPQEKVDVLEALAQKVSDLEVRLDETITENSQLKGVLVENNAKNVFEELASDLALTQQEKFAALAEGIDFDGNLATYEKKLKIIKENYFKSDVSYSSNIE
jgi:hypothetical protein